MIVCIVTPAGAGSRKGNRITAVRWGHLLKELGHQVVLKEAWQGERCDVLVALHALKSYDSIVRFRRQHPHRPVLLALTGTDLYGDIHHDPKAQESLQLASRLIVLQPLGARQVRPHLRRKVRTIFQSAHPPAKRLPAAKSHFDVCVMGHLREVKDPFRTALAGRLLPTQSRLRIFHLGAALSEDMEARARAEMESNPRYRWLGERPRPEAQRILSRCRLLVVTSLLEGGANVISEALAAGVPVLSSRIDGSVGILGSDYPGYFEVGDTEGLARLLLRAETDADFYAELKEKSHARQFLVHPGVERWTWERLLAEVTPRHRPAAAPDMVEMR